MSRKQKIAEIYDTIYPNIGIGKVSGEEKPYKIKGAIEGQKVKFTQGRTRKENIEGKLIEVLEKSPIENYDGCQHRDICGGCVYQNMTYDDEIEYKEKQIKKLLSRSGFELQKMIKSPVFENYRNKMEYTFGDEYLGSPLALGMHKKQKFYEIVNTFECKIVDEDFNIIQKNVRDYFEERGLTFYHKIKHTGELRHLVIRRSTCGEILINLVVTSDTKIDTEEFVRFLLDLKLNGEIKSVYLTLNDSKSDAVVPEKVMHIYGEKYITEEISGLKFKITPFSFFQTNTMSARILYEEAMKMLGDVSDKLIYDLYSGTGTITQILAKKAKKAVGIEIVSESVKSAEITAKENNIENIEFICGDVLEKLDMLKEKPDIIVVDPPREGINPKALEKIMNFESEKILYISCNPVTLARDLTVLTEEKYRIEKLEALDQFPRTTHVEAITLLSRSGSDEDNSR